MRFSAVVGGTCAKAHTTNGALRKTTQSLNTYKKVYSMFSRFLLIAIGAALGANARYFVSLWAGDRFGVAFPFGTTIVNVTGALMLGFVLELTTDRFVTSPEARLLIATGFLGSYTTFSTYMVESITLMRQGSLILGVVNIAGEAILGLLFAVLGMYFARLLGL